MAISINVFKSSVLAYHLNENGNQHCQNSRESKHILLFSPLVWETVGSCLKIESFLVTQDY